jgi:cytochrome bd-type quinol oxidase subunit 2
MSEAAVQPKESRATQRWQARLRAWMQFIVTGVLAFFLLASGWQIYYLHQKIEKAPALELEFSAGGSLNDAQEQWRTLARLEAHAIQQRYHQANVILMARIWTTYLGFVTGMILAVVGAAFILGKLREQTSEISGKMENWQVSIVSTSPGLVMVVLGTILMLMTITTHHQINVKDSPLYFGGTTTGPTTTTTTTSPPKLSEAVTKIRLSTQADSLAKTRQP